MRSFRDIVFFTETNKVVNIPKDTRTVFLHERILVNSKALYVKGFYCSYNNEVLM